MEKIKCRIKYGNKTESHLSQIFTGYKMLEDSGILIIESIEYDKSLKDKYLFSSIIEVILNDTVKVAYDLADGYQSIHRLDLFDKAIEDIDFYFKRSYDPNIHTNHKYGYKVKPLGLNYHVTCKNNPIYKFSSANKGIKKIKDFIKYNKSQKSYYNNIKYYNFESENHFDSYNVMFFVRLWDSNILSLDNLLKSYSYLTYNEINQLYDKWKYQMDYVTSQRIDLVNGLKKELGDKFIGGLEDNEIARKLCPELISKNKYTDKFQFMNMTKSNNICIASVGLHDSIGWKFGEYVAAGKAIVTDPLKYVLPGDFKEDKNYKCYSNIDECINKVKILLSDIDEVHRMEENNIKYYKKYVRPDNLVLNTLNVALDITID